LGLHHPTTCQHQNVNYKPRSESKSKPKLNIKIESKQQIEIKGHSCTPACP
jgi:hypothetical protein